MKKAYELMNGETIIFNVWEVETMKEYENEFNHKEEVATDKTLEGLLMGYDDDTLKMICEHVNSVYGDFELYYVKDVDMYFLNQRI